MKELQKKDEEEIDSSPATANTIEDPPASIPNTGIIGTKKWNSITVPDRAYGFALLLPVKSVQIFKPFTVVEKIQAEY